MTAEEVVFSLRKPVGLRTIDGHPAFSGHTEKGPAVITAERLFAVLFIRQVKTNLETTGDSFGAAEGIEERVEIGAVTLTDIAGVACAAETPAGMVFVVG